MVKVLLLFVVVVVYGFRPPAVVELSDRIWTQIHRTGKETNLTCDGRCFLTLPTYGCARDHYGGFIFRSGVSL